MWSIFFATKIINCKWLVSYLIPVTYAIQFNNNYSYSCETWIGYKSFAATRRHAFVLFLNNSRRYRKPRDHTQNKQHITIYGLFLRLCGWAGIAIYTHTPTNRQQKIEEVIFSWQLCFCTFESYIHNLCMIPLPHSLSLLECMSFHRSLAFEFVISCIALFENWFRIMHNCSISIALLIDWNVYFAEISFDFEWN